MARNHQVLKDGLRFLGGNRTGKRCLPERRWQNFTVFQDEKMLLPQVRNNLHCEVEQAGATLVVYSAICFIDVDKLCSFECLDLVRKPFECARLWR